MRINGWLTGLAAALALCAVRPAQASAWPNTLPAQPLVQAHRVCASGIVYLNRRCRVIDFGPLGQTTDGRHWYYAFFTTHWADRHGRMDRGFPVIFYLQKPATLRLGLWINDEPGLAGHWALTPPVRPVLIKRPEADYLGFTLKATRELDDQRLFRQDKQHWKEIDIVHHSDADQARLDAVTPSGCEAADEGFYDWTNFWLVLALREPLTHTPCGYLTAELAVSGTKIVITSAVYHKAEAKAHGAPTPVAPAQPLTSAPHGPNSPSR